jgi:uncharacterized protein (DUF2236 family)
MLGSWRAAVAAPIFTAMAWPLDQLASRYLAPPGGPLSVDFASPPGAPALFAPDSVTWRVMKNPVALIVGGIAAVLLELAEPRVRDGVWNHTSFKRDPLTRMRRTGYAVMVTVYAPADAARAMIANVNAAHARISGENYRADDPELLNWVQATATYGFLKAYRRYARELSRDERDRFYAEAAPAAALYGAVGAPTSDAERRALFAAMRPKLERSDVIFEFLEILSRARFLPKPAPQGAFIAAAIKLLPAWTRDLLELDHRSHAIAGGGALLRALGAAGERLVINTAPPAQACMRLGLPANHLYR